VVASNLAVYELLVGNAAGAFHAAGEALADFATMGVEHVNRLMCAGVYTLAAAHHGRFDLALAAATPLASGPLDPVRRNLRNTLLTLAMWRQRPDEARDLLPALHEELPLSVRLTSLLARLRWCAWSGADDSAERAELARIGAAHPALLEDSHYYRAWAPFEPASEAVPRLDAMARREQASGADGMARTLSLTALQIELARDGPGAASRARTLAATLHLGLHPAVLPSEAWWAVARALHAGGDAGPAERARREALNWVEKARMPDSDGPDAPQSWREHHPLHAAIRRGF
jgi:hypothetical protein